MSVSAAGTLQAPNFYDEPAEIHDDVHLHHRTFTYQTDDGLVVGGELTVMFTIDAQRSVVWPVFQDFNLWMNSFGYYFPAGPMADLYSKVDRDLGDVPSHLETRKDGQPEGRLSYVVLRVVPERMVVLYQPIPEDGSNGGISPGFHVITLSEFNGKTTVLSTTEHAMRVTDVSEEEAVEPWVAAAPGYIAMWRDHFIPDLKRLVSES